MNTGSWSQTITSPDWGCPMRSVGTLYCYIPVRNDGGSWGGSYSRLYYRINSGSWEDCGNSGYSQTDTVMAYNGGGRIDTQTSVFNFDFSDSIKLSKSFDLFLIFLNSLLLFIIYCSSSFSSLI